MNGEGTLTIGGGAHLFERGSSSRDRKGGGVWLPAGTASVASLNLPTRALSLWSAPVILAACNGMGRRQWQEGKGREGKDAVWEVELLFLPG